MKRSLLLLVQLLLIFTARSFAEAPPKDDVQVLANIDYKSGDALSDYEKCQRRSETPANWPM